MKEKDEEPFRLSVRWHFLLPLFGGALLNIKQNQRNLDNETLVAIRTYVYHKAFYNSKVGLNI